GFSAHAAETAAAVPAMQLIAGDAHKVQIIRTLFPENLHMLHGIILIHGIIDIIQQVVSLSVDGKEIDIGVIQLSLIVGFQIPEPGEICPTSFLPADQYLFSPEI